MPEAPSGTDAALAVVGAIVVFSAEYALSYFAIFIWIARWNFDLLPQYFVWGWTFSGGEYPSMIWLMSLILFAAVAFPTAHWLIRQRRNASGPQ